MMAPADDSPSSGGRKNTTTTTTTTTTTQPLRPPEQGLKCPRCDSPNTKFCYYNNYSLTQPRHFCKTCRRYWTKGGALRNVPVGGGCRKSKKSKSSSASSSSSTSLRLPSDATDHISAIAEPATGLKFFNGLSAAPMDFQLGALPFPRLNAPNTSGLFNSGQLVSFGDFSSPTAIATLPGSCATSVVGLNYPISAVGVYSELGGSSSAVHSNTHSSLASSIESLSSINQDLHWKLQQQRLAMFFGGDNHKETSVATLPTPLLESQQEAIPFQLPESSKAEVNVCVSSVSNKGSVAEANATTAWFLDSTYTSTSTGTNGTARNNNNSSSGNNNTGNWNGIQTWNDMHQFTALP